MFEKLWESFFGCNILEMSHQKSDEAERGPKQSVLETHKIILGVWKLLLLSFQLTNILSGR